MTDYPGRARASASPGCVTRCVVSRDLRARAGGFLLAGGVEMDGGLGDGRDLGVFEGWGGACWGEGWESEV